MWGQILFELLNLAAGSLQALGLFFSQLGSFHLHFNFVMMLIFKVEFFIRIYHLKGWDQKDFSVKMQVQMNTSETSIYEERCIGSYACIVKCYMGIIMED